VDGRYCLEDIGFGFDACPAVSGFQSGSRAGNINIAPGGRAPVARQSSRVSYRRVLIPWAAFAFGYFLVALVFANLFYNLLLWLNPSREAAAWVVGRVLALAVAGLPAMGFGAIAESVFDTIAGAAPAPQLPVVSASPPGEQPASNAPSPEYMITTAFDNAGSVQNWWQARANTKLTDAQVTALGNAERLATAAARAADAEAKGIDAVMRRADRLTGLHMRQVLEDAFRSEQVAVAEQKLVSEQLRREKERYELKRETLEAEHSVDATREFKRIKFDIGKARARARQNDAEVDSKTAEAAVLKIAAELAKLWRQQGPGVESWLDQQIAPAEAAIEEGEADGKDTNAKRVELAILPRFKDAARGAA
jgi:hypothetical protein